MEGRILIVEDEALIADHLAVHLEDFGLTVAGIADDAETAIKCLQDGNVDLVLLDINLSGSLDGVDIAGKINSQYQLPFIYITSNSDQKTMDRVKHTHPAGFIIKPFNAQSLKTNIEIALFQGKQQADVEKDDADGFFLKEKHALIKLMYEDISHAEACDNYSILYTSAGRHILSSTLKVVEGKLAAHNFIRVHRSYVVNVKMIDRIEPRRLFIGEQEIPVSESYRPALLERIKLF